MFFSDAWNRVIECLGFYNKIVAFCLLSLYIILLIISVSHIITYNTLLKSIVIMGNKML